MSSPCSQNIITGQQDDGSVGNLVTPISSLIHSPHQHTLSKQRHSRASTHPSIPARMPGLMYSGEKGPLRKVQTSTGSSPPSSTRPVQTSTPLKPQTEHHQH